MKTKTGSPYIILSCARSGSTSLARILDYASNGCCAIEPVPNLNEETRLAMDGILTKEDRLRIVSEKVVPRVEASLKPSFLYGEKNVTYGPFIQEMHEKLRCRFVFLKRDGRDVVRSLMDWHNNLFGSIYRECRNPGTLSQKAIDAASNLPVYLDTSDYSRPRPLPGEPLFFHWDDLSREEMCAYYWSRVNDLYLNQLSTLPNECWCSIDYTKVTAKAILAVAEFIGLSGLNSDKIDQMLNTRINSLKDRGAEDAFHYPCWWDWDSGQRDRFDRIAGRVMVHLGYYDDWPVRWRPLDYGRIWNTEVATRDWYEWMYKERVLQHSQLMDWVRERDEAGDAIESIADFSCGVAVGYSEVFRDKRFIGIDISKKNVDWCRDNLFHNNHSYLCHDFVAESLPQRCDLVFSHGTIDNTYDIDQALASMVASSNKWIYATFYRGYFPDLAEHRYSWNQEHACFYNDASPRRILAVLQDLGCSRVWIEPVRTHSPEPDMPKFETRVIARI